LIHFYFSLEDGQAPEMGLCLESAIYAILTVKTIFAKLL